MAIYKSSFNQKPEKPKKEKPVKKIDRPKDVNPKPKKKFNFAWIWLFVSLGVFVACVFPNNFLKSFLLGVFGLSIYPVCVLGMLFSIAMLNKAKYTVKRKYLVYLIVCLVDIWFIFHLILCSRLPISSYGAYLGATYMAKTTAGGLIFSLISYPLVKFLTYVGAYILSGIVLAVFVGLLIDYIQVQRNLEPEVKKNKFNFSEIEKFEFGDREEPVLTEEEQKKKIAKRRLGLEKGETTIISSSLPKFDYTTLSNDNKPMSKRDYILTPLEPVIPPEKSDDVFRDQNTGRYSKINKVQTNNFDTAEEIVEKPSVVDTEEIKDEVVDNDYIKPSNIDNVSIESSDTEDEADDDLFLDEEEMEGYETAFETETDFEYNEDDIEDLNENYKETEDDSNNETVEETETVEEIIPNIQETEFVDNYANRQINSSSLGSTVETEVVRPTVDISKFNLPNKISKSTEVEQVKLEDIKPKEEIPPYVAPPVELLNYLENPSRISDEELQDNIERLEQVLEDFKVPAKVNNVQVGPAVTRYELTMPRGISVNKIAQMSDDIAMTLASNGAIRVEAPIPGKNSVGIEVPNAQVCPVSLRELIDSNEFKVRGNPLSFVLGKDINGDIIFCNLDKMPHVLVAGSTGSGKSVCLNTMLLSMCYKAGPQDLRLILVDPKMVEFTTYNGLPHLLIPEVITGKEMTINALDWAIKEMERRYALFAKNHVVNINEFNKTELVRNNKNEKLPFIVIVVDELADLMLEAKREIEDKIAKLAAKARAAGIHLVLATQRPSVDVITGTVKANLPSRIAFALTNYMDSKTVLDGGGAEKLLGKGDMLFKPQDKPEARRVQGAYVSNSEIAAVVEFIKQNNKPVYDDDAGRSIKSPHKAQATASNNDAVSNQEFDPVLKEALRMFIQTKQASGSMISRRYAVGFNRAGRIMDQMERAGFIGQQEGSKPRQVLITMDEYNAIFGDDDN